MFCLAQYSWYPENGRDICLSNEALSVMADNDTDTIYGTDRWK